MTALSLGGCFTPEHSVDELGPGQRPGSLFADGGMQDAPGGCPTPTVKALRVRVRTTAYGGRYAPKNIGAIWIENDAGAFIHTIDVWAKTRARWLVAWQDASDGNRVDAISSATLSSHITHDRIWNMQAGTCQIPAGNYRVVIETTDYDGKGATLVVPFTKGAAPSMVTAPDTAQFHDVLVEVN